MLSSRCAGCINFHSQLQVVTTWTSHLWKPHSWTQQQRWLCLVVLFVKKLLDYFSLSLSICLSNLQFGSLLKVTKLYIYIYFKPCDSGSRITADGQLGWAGVGSNSRCCKSLHCGEAVLINTPPVSAFIFSLVKQALWKGFLLACWLEMNG